MVRNSSANAKSAHLFPLFCVVFMVAYERDRLRLRALVRAIEAAISGGRGMRERSGLENSECKRIMVIDRISCDPGCQFVGAYIVQKF